MGDESTGLLCYSENSWYESILKICKNLILVKKIADKAYLKFNELYNPNVWAEDLFRILEWLNET